MEALIFSELTGAEIKIFLHLARMTWGFGRKSIGFSPSSCNLPIGPSTARKALASLVGFGVLKCLVSPVGPNPGEYSIKPVKEWTLPAQKRAAKDKSRSKTSGLPAQKRAASRSKTSGFSSAIPTPTSDCHTPKERSKERLLKKTPTTPYIPQGGPNEVVEGDYLESLHNKVFSKVVAKIESRLGRIGDSIGQRLWAALRPPANGDLNKWAKSLVDRFGRQLAQVENSWEENSSAIKSPVGLLVSRLETEIAQLRKETEGR